MISDERLAEIEARAAEQVWGDRVFASEMIQARRDVVALAAEVHRLKEQVERVEVLAQRIDAAGCEGLCGMHIRKALDESS